MSGSAPGGGAALGLSKLTKRYGDAHPVVAGVDLDVRAGEFVTLLGPSGCGKTTILRMVAGLVEPSGGNIRVDGTDVTAMPPHKRNMGLVFQNYALFPHMSVAGNVAFGLEMRGVARSERAERVREALALVRLEALRDRRPRALSGGQQQRVALARALVIRPAVLLLDEPLSNLDAKLRENLRDEIRAIQERLRITTVFVTHDQSEALTMSDRVVVMRDGRIEQIGAPMEIYDAPETPFVATFIGRVNRLSCTVTASDAVGTRAEGDGVRVVSRRVLPSGAKAEAMIRPHRIHLTRGADAAAGENAVSGTVRRAVFAGETVQTEVETAAGLLVIDRDRPDFGPGDAVVASWSVADCLLFPV